MMMNDPAIEIINVPAVSHRANAPALLFIHGAYAAAWCWNQGFMSYLAESGYDCYALSLRGHGGSGGHEVLSLASLDDFQRDIAKAIEQIARPVVLVGHSMGGFLAMRHARQHPVAGLACLAPVPPEGLIGSTLHLMCWHPALLLELNCVQYAGQAPQLSKLRDLLFSSDLPDERLLAFARQFQRESDRAILELSMQAMSYLWTACQRPQCPSIVLGGGDDVLMPAHQIHSAACALGVRAEFIPGVAHVMMLDMRWQRVAERLKVWLETL